ncbi:hypothetical protein B0H14DRAFT_3731138 [Mycena olivaceomarginata]|nr:hypothetical protein B0H14DRAFT_3731138 [Mycena olivaceomarginata]
MDLVSMTWSYVWIDWTCMPQVGEDGKRTPLEKPYFGMMLQCIPMVVRDCAFVWRFPAWEPRAWILYEIAEHAVGHRQYVVTEDNKPFLRHVQEMVLFGVHPVLDKYKYRCTNASDMDLVTGRLELLVILAKLFPDDVTIRRELLDILNKPANGSVTHYEYNRFTPTFNLTSGIAVAFRDDEKQQENGAERAPSCKKERPDK